MVVTVPFVMPAIMTEVGLIRFGGHFLKGGYDVPTDGKEPQESTTAPAVR